MDYWHEVNYAIYSVSMKIQISDIISGKDRSKKIDEIFNIESFEFEGDTIKPITPCKVNGVITSDNDVLVVTANIKTELEMVCSRCLDTFIYPIDIDIEERFTKSKELQDDEELIFVEDDTLDIIQIVENCIISTLPIKRLCKEDCKGLCSQCGTNKNVKECQCDDFDVDIRLAKLRELFGE